jgi:formate--tetrahydrofolate ligase
VLSQGWEKGGEGTRELASKVAESAESGESNFQKLYDWNDSIDAKIKTIAREIYRAEEVEYSPQARREMKTIEALGLDKLPICMAKTQKSFSDNEKMVNAPEGFTVTVREFEMAIGAGFLIPILGKMMRMPGLPAVPASEGMDIDDNGLITGLS